MSSHIYLCYAPEDVPFADRLRTALADEGFVVWQPDDPFALDNAVALQQTLTSAWVVLVVISTHFFQHEQRVATARQAMRLMKPLLPLVVEQLEQLPPTLRRRQPIVFTHGFADALLELVRRLTWIRSPRGEIQALRDRLADLERTIARGHTHPQMDALRQQADELRQEIALREGGSGEWRMQNAEFSATRQDVEDGERDDSAAWQAKGTGEVPVAVAQGSSHPGRHADWGEAPDISLFYGRQHELSELTRWIVADQCRMVGIFGMGGMGKTALVTRLAHECREQFAYILWKSLRNAPPLAELLGECIVFLSNQQRTDLPDDIPGRISLLLEYLRQQRCLLVLDNVETILQGGNRAGAYREGYEPYGQLLQRVGESQHQSLVLLTSREKPREFARLEGATSPVRTWQLSGVSHSEGQAILQDKGLAGSEDAWNDLVHRYSGNPLALKLTAESIREIFAGDIAEFLSEGEMMLGDISEVLEQQFDRLSPLEQEIISWLAIEREPVSADTLRESMVVPGQKRAFLEALQDLRRRSLIEQGATGFTLQNVVMEYATERLIDQVCAEIVRGEVGMLNTHALMKAQAKEYVRNSQVRLILNEVLERLAQQLGGREAVVAQLTGMLGALKR